MGDPQDPHCCQQDADEAKGRFGTSAGKTAYEAVSSTVSLSFVANANENGNREMLHVMTREELTEEETAEVKEHMK